MFTIRKIDNFIKPCNRSLSARVKFVSYVTCRICQLVSYKYFPKEPFLSLSRTAVSEMKVVEPVYDLPTLIKPSRAVIHARPLLTKLLSGAQVTQSLSECIRRGGKEKVSCSIVACTISKSIDITFHSPSISLSDFVGYWSKRTS